MLVVVAWYGLGDLLLGSVRSAGGARPPSSAVHPRARPRVGVRPRRRGLVAGLVRARPGRPLPAEHRARGARVRARARGAGGGSLAEDEPGASRRPRVPPRSDRWRSWRPAGRAPGRAGVRGRARPADGQGRAAVPPGPAQGVSRRRRPRRRPGKHRQLLRARGRDARRLGDAAGPDRERSRRRGGVRRRHVRVLPVAPRRRVRLGPRARAQPRLGLARRRDGGRRAHDLRGGGKRLRGSRARAVRDAGDPRGGPLVADAGPGESRRVGAGAGIRPRRQADGGVRRVRPRPDRARPDAQAGPDGRPGTVASSRAWRRWQAPSRSAAPGISGHGYARGAPSSPSSPVSGRAGRRAGIWSARPCSSGSMRSTAERTRARSTIC